MRRRQVAQKIEPENGKLRQHFALVGNAGGQDVVERRDAIGGDDQQPFVDAVDVAHFAAAEAFDAGKIGFQNDGVVVESLMEFTLAFDFNRGSN